MQISALIWKTLQLLVWINEKRNYIYLYVSMCTLKSTLAPSWNDMYLPRIHTAMSVGILVRRCENKKKTFFFLIVFAMFCRQNVNSQRVFGRVAQPAQTLIWDPQYFTISVSPQLSPPRFDDFDLPPSLPPPPQLLEEDFPFFSRIKWKME